MDKFICDFTEDLQILIQMTEDCRQLADVTAYDAGLMDEKHRQVNYPPEVLADKVK